MHPESKTVIVICGPTASGKTALAIEVARHFETEIISADSRQCFKELNIGVARPSIEELKSVPHHFIASHSLQEEITARTFENYALEISQKIFCTKDILVMAGGSGLYIDAFCRGLDQIPDIDPLVRNSINEEYGKKGIEWLQKCVRQEDPLYVKSGEMKNPRRLMRALEVIRGTGFSIRHYQQQILNKRPFNIVKFGIDIATEQLTKRIESRTQSMIVNGLVEEVSPLLPFEFINPLQTVGYKEIFSFIHGRYTLSEATAKIITHTRQYAKRQMTWFRKDTDIIWMREQESMSGYIADFMKGFKKEH
jgi:tRNA dimethylallyltransferase